MTPQDMKQVDSTKQKIENKIVEMGMQADLIEINEGRSAMWKYVLKEIDLLIATTVQEARREGIEIGGLRAIEDMGIELQLANNRIFDFQSTWREKLLTPLTGEKI